MGIIWQRLARKMAYEQISNLNLQNVLGLAGELLPTVKLQYRSGSVRVVNREGAKTDTRDHSIYRTYPRSVM